MKRGRKGKLCQNSEANHRDAGVIEHVAQREAKLDGRKEGKD